MKLEIDLDFENIEESNSDDAVRASLDELIELTSEDAKYYVNEFLLERDFKFRSLINFCNTGEFL